MKNNIPKYLLVILCALLGGWLVLASDEKPPDKKKSTNTASSAKSGDAKKTGVKADETQKEVGKKKELYGNMPEDLEPYGRFVKEPYHKYFVPSDAAIAFWGPGRDKPEPEVETVKIGLLAPIERSHETYMGKPILNGMQMALDEANAAGGYKGKRFEAVVRNDSGLWGASANEIVTFSYEDKVWAIIGTVDGANSHIAIRVALRTDVPIMNVADLDATFVETRIPWVFRVIPDDRQNAYTIAYYVYKQLGLQRVAILRANNRYGRFGVAQFKKSSIRLGRPAPIEINYEMNYDKVNMDFETQMDRLEKAKPDGVILWADPEPAGLLVKKMREMGMNIPVIACERIINPAFLKMAGSAAEGVLATSPFNPDAANPKLIEFKKRYQARFGEPPNAYAAHSYDGTQMVIEAIRRAGLNRYLIRDALEEMRHWDGVTGEINMDDVYTNRRPVCMAVVKDGKFVYGVTKVDHLF
jgi:ABC-type branched-subunit amino acid transport system substrate-binding protein